MSRGFLIRAARDGLRFAIVAGLLAAGLVQAAPAAAASGPVVTALAVTPKGDFNTRPVGAVWTVKVTADKALADGTLAITYANGELVRSVDVEVATGSKTATATWDGTDIDDADVPNNVSYTWTLDLPGAAGGTLTRNGGPVTGTVTVVNKPLGTMKGAKPKVSDTTPVLGQKLTAKTGTWKPSKGIAYTYQWRRDGVDIPDATARTYTTDVVDVGHRLAVVVSGVVNGWNPDPLPRVSAATAAVAKLAISPKPVPKLSPTKPKVDVTVTASPGKWPAGVTPQFAWYKVSKKGKSTLLTGSGATHVVTGAEIGYRLKVVVSGQSERYKKLSVTSKKTSSVPKGSFTTLGARPTVAVSTGAGVPRPGATLTATAGTYVPSASPAYQWYRVNAKGTATAIASATAGNYTLTGADAGNTVLVQVTATRSGYPAHTQRSLPTAVVQAGIAAVTPLLTTSSPEIGTVLAITPASGPAAWSPSGVVVAHQWYRDAAPISGATAPTYTVETADLGHTLRVRLTGTVPADASYPAVTRWSVPTDPVPLQQFSWDDGEGDPAPTVDIDYFGGVATATVDALTPAPDQVDYQWFVNGTVRTGATAATFDFSSLPGGATFSVQATAKKAGYLPLVLTSRSYLVP